MVELIFITFSFESPYGVRVLYVKQFLLFSIHVRLQCKAVLLELHTVCSISSQFSMKNFVGEATL